MTRPFLHFNGQTVSYGSFDERVTALARGLLSLGVGKDAAVGLWMTNSIDWVACQFAIYRAGARLVPLYSYYKRSELEHVLRQADVDTLVMFDRFLEKIDAASILLELVPELALPRKGRVDCAAFPELRHVVMAGAASGQDIPGAWRLDELESTGSDSGLDDELTMREHGTGPFDIMNIMYTSGTTGFPKGGMSMHVTNLATITLWSEAACMTQDDVILCHVPLFTNFGALYAAGLAVRNGCRLIITEQFDAGQSLRLIEEQRVTYVPGTPSMFRMLLDHPDMTTRDLRSLRCGHVAGASLTDGTMREIIERLVPGIMQAWGLSECGGLSTASTSQHPLEKRLRSVGKPLANARVWIVDPETFEPKAASDPGEIVLGDVCPGSCVGMGYYGNPGQTAASITSEGWFRTGDIGHFDADGFLHVSGRVDDMFTVGGFNVYPAEIENKLTSLQGVREAHVVGIPDRRLGNVPVAWIASSDESAPPSEEAVIAYCRGIMAAQKVPRAVMWFRPGELPMTAAGKIKKKELADYTMSRLPRHAIAT